MIYYLDTSALVKAYVQEARSKEVRDLLHQSRAAPASWLYVSRLTYPETLSAIARRENRGEIAGGDARILQSRVAADFTGPDRLYQIIEPTAAVVNDAAGLVIRHRLRGFDAVQLAGALLLSAEAGGACTVAAADIHLLNAASAEGISILDLRWRRGGRRCLCGPVRRSSTGANGEYIIDRGPGYRLYLARDGEKLKEGVIGGVRQLWCVPLHSAAPYHLPTTDGAYFGRCPEDTNGNVTWRFRPGDGNGCLGDSAADEGGYLGSCDEVLCIPTFIGTFHASAFRFS